ncbi:unnamed protein product [Meloidogyne enterolobii]|uniref:Uncharacterized protein n=1 Tax=Meloidogyne enterolobii TaxID=390850 RepID=A0ACB0YPT0_MELEN
MELTIEFKDFVEIRLTNKKDKGKIIFSVEDAKFIRSGIKIIKINGSFGKNYRTGIEIAGRCHEEKYFSVNFLCNLKKSRNDCATGAG